MATFRIPNSIGEIKQNNFKETEGEFYETYNLDLVSNRGKILTSKKLKKTLDIVTDFGGDTTICDLDVWNGDYYVLTEGSLWRDIAYTAPGNFSLVSGSASSFTATMCVFDNELRIVDTTDIRRYTGSGSVVDNWWTVTLSGTALTSRKPHITAVVQSQKETFYVTDGNWIRYYEKGAGSTQNVELSASVTACTLAPALDGSMWVGTFNETTDNSYVYQIYTNEQVDATTVYRQAYIVDGRAVLAMWVKNNTPYIITEKGVIQAFNGVGFETVARFPFNFGTRFLSGVENGQIQDSNRSRPIHPRGVKVQRDVAFININTDTVNDDYAINSRSHSGVWTFDHLTNQLTHYMAPAKDTTENGSHKADFAYPLVVPDDSTCEIMVGGDYGDGAGSTLGGAFVTDTEYGIGWFVTPEIVSDTVTESYNALYHKATLYDNAKIYTLYRTTKRDTLRFESNWLDATRFNTLDDVSTLSIGDMVNVSHLYGAGRWSVVTDISKSALTYSITVKDAIGEAGKMSKMYSDNFKLLGFDTETSTYDEVNTYVATDGEVKSLSVNATAPWIQYMVLFDGRVEYRQFIANGNAKSMV